MTIPTVLIGIPAYNEHANIARLLDSLLTQQTVTCRITEIVVVSDASSDSTDSIVSRYHRRGVKLLRNTHRMGQAMSQNKILKLMTQDVAILINADVIIEDTGFVDSLIAPLLKRQRVGMVTAATLPLQPRNLLQRILLVSHDLKNSMFGSWRAGENILMSNGRARAFSSRFVRDLRWPDVVAEDAYAYIRATELGLAPVLAQSACVYYALPLTIHDHFSQSRRFAYSRRQIEHYFDPAFVRRLYSYPKFEALRAYMRYLFRHPWETIAYTALTLVSRLRSNSNNTPRWDTAGSTKILAQYD